MLLFLYRLAYKLGYASVSRMASEMTAEDLSHWIAASNMGLDRDGWNQAGTVAATVHNEITSALYGYAGKTMPENAIHERDRYIPYRADRPRSDPQSVDRYLQRQRRRHGGPR